MSRVVHDAPDIRAERPKIKPAVAAVSRAGRQVSRNATAGGQDRRAASALAGTVCRSGRMKLCTAPGWTCTSGRDLAAVQHVAELQEHGVDEHLVGGAVDQVDRALDIGRQRDRVERLVRRHRHPDRRVVRHAADEPLVLGGQQHGVAAAQAEAHHRHRRQPQRVQQVADAGRHRFERAVVELGGARLRRPRCRPAASRPDRDSRPAR